MIAYIGGCEHIGYDDQLTGFCNRFRFLEKIKQLDLSGYLPISFILGDINDLKLINDIFGYDKGDRVIKGIAAVFKKNCQRNGIISRWGGDEFAVVLPQTPYYLTLKILRAIKKGCGTINTVPLKVTTALGIAVKENPGQDILEVLKKAEAGMCRNKMVVAKEMRRSTIASLVEHLGKKNYETEEHVWRMQRLALQFGSALCLKDSQMEDLTLTITLHDIGKLAVPEQILMKPGKLTPEEWAILKEHSERGYRIALFSSELAHVAPAILAHHERWDGKGYPLGLRGNEIPLLSRIVSIVDSYDVMTNERPYKKAISKKEAQQELQRCAGSQFDPELVKVFLNLDLLK